MDGNVTIDTAETTMTELTILTNITTTTTTTITTNTTTTVQLTTKITTAKISVTTEKAAASVNFNNREYPNNTDLTRCIERDFTCLKTEDGTKEVRRSDAKDEMACQNICFESHNCIFWIWNWNWKKCKILDGPCVQKKSDIKGIAGLNKAGCSRYPSKREKRKQSQYL